MIRVFLDANILFSAAYREVSGVALLWRKQNLQLVTSAYALNEAERNLARKKPDALERLGLLTKALEITNAASLLKMDYGLPLKDRPILAAAIGADCRMLLTGDIADFGHLLGTICDGVEVMTVSIFFNRHPD